MYLKMEKNIKKARTDIILWRCNVQGETNKLNVQTYSDWLNICNSYDNKPKYSCSYQKNDFMNCKYKRVILV